MTHPSDDRNWPFAYGSKETLALATTIWGGILLLWQRRRNSWLGLLFLPLTALYLLVLYFFRDPNRKLLTDEGLVVSPGDGQVVNIVEEWDDQYLGRPVIRISIFLSVTNVHVQRAPIAGIVNEISHQPGLKLQAFRSEASQLNENIAMRLETAYGPLVVKQIAGIMARRCVNYATVGESLTTGQRFGLIRFGSRVDLFLPPEAKVLVSVGDNVQGGISPLAHFLPGGD